MTAGHTHIDRSRERRVNSARSDDNSYPKIKTPSRDDTLICSPSLTDEPDLKSDLKTTSVYDHRSSHQDLLVRDHARKSKKKSRSLVPPERKKRREVHLSEDQSSPLHKPSPTADIFSETDRSSVEQPRSQRQQRAVNQVPNVKRSISISLPNQMTHKLRNRIHTTNPNNSESTAQPEFRVRLSKPRNRRSSDRIPDMMSQAEQDLRLREKSARHRRKHYSEYYPAEDDSRKLQSQRATLQDLLSHFNEIEVRNKAKMQQRNARRGVLPVNLPEDVTNLSLLKFVERSQEEAKGSSSVQDQPSSRQSRKGYQVKQVPGKEGKGRSARTKSEFSTLEEHFSQMKIEGRYNTGTPDNVCSRTDLPGPAAIPPRTTTTTTIRLSDSDSGTELPLAASESVAAAAAVKTLTPGPEKPARNPRKNLRHYMEYTKVTKGGQSFIQPGRSKRVNTLQKIEVAPKQIASTPETSRKVIAPDTARKLVGSPKTKRKMVATEPTQKVATTESTRKVLPPTSTETSRKTRKRDPGEVMSPSVERSAKVADRSRSIERKPRNSTAAKRHPDQNAGRGPAERVKAPMKPPADQGPSTATRPMKSAAKPSIPIRSEPDLPAPIAPVSNCEGSESTASADEVTSGQEDQGNNIIRMLKKIDKQTLKRRLSLDKLADLDSDDESHLDKMLSEISAFVEGKIKRRRVKTGCSAGIRFGPSTVHVYDPLEKLEPISLKELPPKVPESILKTSPTK